MFFNKRKRFNGDVTALLPAFGIDTKEAGVFKVLDILDIAWDQSYSTYEAALLVAYSFVAGLYDHDFERAALLAKDRLLPIQSDWIGKGIVRAQLVEKWPLMLRERAEHSGPSL
jgi:hypothetical protein